MKKRVYYKRWNKILISIIMIIMLITYINPIKVFADKSTSEEVNLEEDETSNKESDSGFFGKNIKFDRGEFFHDSTMTYLLFTPSSANENVKTPLIVWLHGADERAGYPNGSEEAFLNVGLPKVIRDWKFEGFNAYILCPQLEANVYNGATSHWTTQDSKDKLKNLLDKFIKEKNIDTNNIIITGHSLGGAGSQYMAYHLSDYFSKLVVFSGYEPFDKFNNKNSVDINQITIPTRGYVGQGWGDDYRQGNYGEDPESIKYMQNKFKPTFGEENTFFLKAGHGEVTSEAFNMDEDGNERSDLVEWMFEDYRGASMINQGVFDEESTFKEPELVPGNIEEDIMPYALFTPTNIKNNQSIPMIVWLHGSGECGGSPGKMLQSGLPKLLNNGTLSGFKAYVLCPHLSNNASNGKYGNWSKGEWTDLDTAEDVSRLIDKIVKEKGNVNENNIVLVGHSLGGMGVEYMAIQMPKRFSKLAVISGYSLRGEGYTTEDVKKLNIPTRGYNGTADSAYMIGEFKTTFGEEAVFVVPGGHPTAPDNSFALDESPNNGRSDLIEWFFDDYRYGVSSPSGSSNNEEEEEKEEFKDIVSPSTGLDTMSGILLEPTIEFFTFLVDSVMSLFTSVMTENDFLPVMVESTDEILYEGISEDIGTTFTIRDTSQYRGVTGKLKVSYPNFTYSPEEIFAGNIDILDANFIKKSNDDENWNNIRNLVSAWYKVLRMAAIIGLISILIYTGIKIIITSNTKDKAKYKGMLINWFVAAILAFSMHYIMAFILSATEEFTKLLNDITGTVQVRASGIDTFNTNLIGLARFQIQQQHFTAKIGNLIIYIALVAFTFKFTFVYFKRVLSMAFLTIISPIVALTYPIDKMNGEAKGFQMWLKEYIFNALLQPMHYLLYYILVSSSMALAVNTPLYGVVAIMFISGAERLLKRIFGFDKASGGTVGGVAGAFATGMITSSLMNFIRNPGGNRKNKSGIGNSNNGYQDYDFFEDLPNGILDDTSDYESLLNLNLRGGRMVYTGGPTIPGLNGGIYSFRLALANMSMDELGKLEFGDGDNKSIGSILDMIARKQGQILYGGYSLKEQDRLQSQISGLEAKLNSRIYKNEERFGDYLQYSDGDKRTTSQLMDEIKRLNLEAQNPNLSDEERQKLLTKSSKLMKTVKRRMAENQYIQRNGNLEEMLQKDKPKNQTENQADNAQNNRQGNQQENAQNNRRGNLPENAQNNRQGNQPENVQKDKPKNQTEIKEPPRVIKGMKNVAKTIAKPVWDTEKDVRYNGERLAGNVLKGVAGATVGIAAAAVQAGISITDGKYNVAEGIATVGAGMAAVSNIGKNPGELKKTYKEAMEDRESINEYGRQWYNRDDVIGFYNREFPGQGKEMRERAVKNYITRGITDVDSQKKAMKYANVLKKQRGLGEEEADKIAIATLQYKQKLTMNSNYNILFNDKKRDEYLDIQAEAYTGAASKETIKNLHRDLIENVKDFDIANR